MRWASAAALLLALVVPAGAGAQPAATLRIATEGTYRPWNFYDAQGRLAGFDIDVANEVCRRLRARCTIQTQDWDGMIPALQMRKFDAVIADMSITPLRREAIDFSIPYARDDQTFLTRDPRLRLSNQGRRVDIGRDEAARRLLAGELAGLRIGVLGADSSIAFFRRYTDPRRTRLVRYASAELMQLDFVAGRIDASLASVGRANEVSARGDGLGFRPVGPVLHGGVLGEGIGIGLAKGRPELKAAIDAALAAALRDGTLRRLSLKWMDADLTPGPAAP